MDLQFIVGRLNEPPFNKAIRAVDFDGKTPDEHLQTVNDVLASLDVDMKADVRAISREDTVEQMLQFLMIHKYQLIPGSEVERLDWIEGIRHGEKKILLPILHWLLSDYENLCKRTYLSRYLMPVDVPSEYLMQNNGNVEELLDAYKELQAEFVEVHKQYETVTANMDRPTSDIRDGIKQMEAEEKQLLDRLQREQAQTRNDPIFQLLLAEASNMRQQQDREIILDDQKREQLQCLASTKQRQNQARRMLDIAASCEAKPIEAVLGELERELQKAVENLESNVMPKRHKAELMLLQVEKDADLDKDEGDVEYLEEMAAQLEETLSRKQEELLKLGYVGKLDALAKLKQDVNDEAAKLEQLQGDVDAKTMEKELLLSNNEELRDSLHDSDGDGIMRPDGTGMNRNDFAQFKERVDSSSKASIVAKQEIAKIEDDILELKRSEDSLKGQCQELKNHRKEEEERAGVSGFQDINDQLEETGKQTAELNKLKAQTLDDISATVQGIADTIEGKKEELEPKVNELKQKRKQFQELQEQHSRDKETYDAAVAKVTERNSDLENECSRLQGMWLEKERSYHFLCAKDEIASAKIGNLAELGSLKELYENKSAEQQHMAKKLRAQQKGRAEQTTEYISKQKAMFANLKKLLELKAKCQRICFQLCAAISE